MLSPLFEVIEKPDGGFFVPRRRNFFEGEPPVPVAERAKSQL
jgi:hypothetical protein